MTPSIPYRYFIHDLCRREMNEVSKEDYDLIEGEVVTEYYAMWGNGANQVLKKYKLVQPHKRNKPLINNNH